MGKPEHPGEIHTNTGRTDKFRTMLLILNPVYSKLGHSVHSWTWTRTEQWRMQDNKLTWLHLLPLVRISYPNYFQVSSSRTTVKWRNNINTTLLLFGSRPDLFIFVIKKREFVSQCGIMDTNCFSDESPSNVSPVSQKGRGAVQPKIGNSDNKSWNG